jgi:hypothetical protein
VDVLPSEDLVAAHRCAIFHRAAIERSTLCACFFCGETFEPARIRSWTDGRQTAVCPFCSVDAVLGDASGFPLTPQFLGDMKRRWFGQEPHDFA